MWANHRKACAVDRLVSRQNPTSKTATGWNLERMCGTWPILITEVLAPLGD